jgi:uncharacterized membrane protein YjfL (UPF0719 family)
MEKIMKQNKWLALVIGGAFLGVSLFVASCKPKQTYSKNEITSWGQPVNGLQIRISTPKKHTK